MADFFDFLDSPVWRGWPFNSGYGEQIGPAIARMIFVSFIFIAIILFLRLLYGPNGFFRDKEMDREAEEERIKERKELKALFEKGEITEFEYEIKLKRLEE